MEIRKINGNPLGRLDIRGVTIRYKGDDFSYDVIRIEEIHCRYDLISLLGSGHRLDELYFLKPHVWIKSTSSGITRIPESSGSLEKFFRFAVEKLSVSKGQIIYQGSNKAEAVKNINLDGSLYSEKKESYIQMRNGSFDFVARKISINEMKGNVIWKVGKDNDSGSRIILLQNYSVRTGKSKLVMNGRFNPESMNIKLRVKTAPLDLKEAACVLDYATGETGRLNGIFDIWGGSDSLNVKGVTDGIIGGFALEHFSIDMLAKNSKIRMNHFEGELNGASVEGSGGYLIGVEELLEINLRAENIDLSKGFYPGARLPETDFTGKIGIKYCFSTNEMKFQLDLERGHFRRLPYEHATIAGVHIGDTLFLEKVWMQSQTHNMNIHGSIAGKDKVNLFVDIQCEAADTLFPYFNIEKYRAGVDVKGLWSGSFDSWDLRLSGSCNNFEHRGVFIPDGRIKFAIKKDEYYSLSMDVSSDSCYINPVGFSGIELSLDYYRGKTNIKRLDLKRSAFKASADVVAKSEIFIPLSFIIFPVVPLNTTKLSLTDATGPITFPPPAAEISNIVASLFTDVTG